MKLCSRPEVVVEPKPQITMDGIRDIVMAAVGMQLPDQWDVVIESVLHTLQAMEAIDAYASHRTFGRPGRIEYKVVVRIEPNGEVEDFLVGR